MHSLSKIAPVLSLLGFVMPLVASPAEPAPVTTESRLASTLAQDIENRSPTERALYLVCLNVSEQHEQCISFYENDLRDNEKNDAASRIYYRSLLALGQLGKGGEVLKTATSDKPRMNAEYFFAFGMVRLKKGEGSDAMADFNEAIKADPTFAPPYLELAKRTRDPKEALRLCTRVLALTDANCTLARQATDLIAFRKLVPK